MMNHPFCEVFFKWLLPWLASGWGVVVVATPPPEEGKESIPFVVGNLETVMPTLVALLEGAREPSLTTLPVRLVMLPGAMDTR